MRYGNVVAPQCKTFCGALVAQTPFADANYPRPETGGICRTTPQELSYICAILVLVG